jgi:hypothetical protein
MADWIGRAGVAGNQESLATASPKILIAAVAGSARFPHPVSSSERNKSW